MRQGQRMGQALKAARERRGYSLRSLADRLQAFGLDWRHSTVDKVERGERGLRVGEFIVLAMALNWSPDALALPDGEPIEVGDVTLSPLEARAWWNGQQPPPHHGWWDRDMIDAILGMDGTATVDVKAMVRTGQRPEAYDWPIPSDVEDPTDLMVRKREWQSTRPAEAQRIGAIEDRIGMLGDLMGVYEHLAVYRDPSRSAEDREAGRAMAAEVLLLIHDAIPRVLMSELDYMLTDKDEMVGSVRDQRADALKSLADRLADGLKDQWDQEDGS